MNDKHKVGWDLMGGALDSGWNRERGSDTEVLLKEATPEESERSRRERR